MVVAESPNEIDVGNVISVYVASAVMLPDTLLMVSGVTVKSETVAPVMFQLANCLQLAAALAVSVTEPPSATEAAEAVPLVTLTV